LLSLADHHKKRGSVENQQAALQQALHIQEKNYGPEHAELLETLHTLAGAHKSLGDDEGERLLSQRIEGIQSGGRLKLKPEHTLVGKRYSSKDLRLRSKERALGRAESQHGKEHPQVVPALMELAHHHSVHGNPEKQKESLKRALHIQEQSFGGDHPDIPEMLMKLATAHKALGHTEEERHVLERAASLRRGTLASPSSASHVSEASLSSPMRTNVFGMLEMDLTSPGRSARSASAQEESSSRDLFLRALEHNPQDTAAMTSLSYHMKPGDHVLINGAHLTLSTSCVEPSSWNQRDLGTIPNLHTC